MPSAHAPYRARLDAATAPTWLDQIALRAPDAAAVVVSGGTWSSADLVRRAGWYARWLDHHGLAQGQPVAALVWSSAQALALILAGACTARPVAPVGPLLTTHELAGCLDGLGASALVVESATRSLGAEVAASTGCRVLELDEAPAGAEGEPPPQRDVAAGDVAVILHTSGTSGAPKRVSISQAHLAARTVVIGQLLGLGPGDRYVTAKPIHHVGGLGLTLAALACGAAVIPCRRFSVETWRELGMLAPTHASVVPSMVEVLLGAGALALPGLRVLQYGGGPIHPDTVTTLARSLPEIELVGLYGQTEGSPLAVLSPADHRRAAADRPDLLGSAGRPAPGVELAIESPDQGGVGEVVARAAHIVLPDPDGWLRTGDLGRVDEGGYLHLVGRKGDVITRGGENVHPREVEDVLASHPALDDVVVAGVPDRRLGEAVAAWIVLAAGAPTVSDDDLRRWARARLAGFKVPEVWIRVPALPRNAAGKVVRRLLPLPVEDATVRN